MKKLNQFQQFNFAAWQTGKKFMVSGVKYNEKFKVHLINETNMEDADNYSVKDIIIFKKIGKCTVWGDFASQLSVEAEVEVVE